MYNNPKAGFNKLTTEIGLNKFLQRYDILYIL